MFQKEFYLKDLGAWVAPPEGVRLSEGPRYCVKQVPWSRQQAFYQVHDLETNDLRYLTAWETRQFVKVSLNAFKKRFVKRRPGVFHRRYKVSRIPKYLFIKRTGRTHSEVREYFYKF